MSFSGTEVTITRTDQNYEFTMYPVRSVDANSRTSSFSIAPPGQSARENIFLTISGQQADIVVDTVLWDDGTDRSNGTAPSDNLLSGQVVTLNEQWWWLDQYIDGEGSISAAWTLTDTADFFIGDKSETDPLAGSEDVVLEDIDTTPIGEDTERWKPVRLSFRRGKQVG